MNRTPLGQRLGGISSGMPQTGEDGANWWVDVDHTGYSPEEVQCNMRGNTLCIDAADNQNFDHSSNTRDMQHTGASRKRINYQTTIPASCHPQFELQNMGNNHLRINFRKNQP